MARKPVDAPAHEGAGVLLRNSVWQAGYERGVMDSLHALIKDPAGMLERAKRITEPVSETAALADALRRRVASRTGAERSASTRRLRRQLRDEAQAVEFAALVRAGDTTEQARAKMKIGDVKAKRLRAIAVRLNMIRPRQMKPSV
jgi:aspartate aminotransferase-like enzyme